MNTIAQQTANRFREVILNGTWIANTNFKDQLNGLEYQIATTQMGTFNTIAVLAQHIHYYINGINNVFKGGNLDIRDQFSFDFAPITSQNQWETFLAQFWNDAEAFTSFVEKMTDEQLNQAFVDEKYGTYLRNIDGMIEHSYYHLGQIVLLKKMIQK
ncbi:MAG: DUF1572 family protein [Flavobacteriales bacterium]|nr:DUF1572 family protein [Flavobacteriales bacterium]